MSGSFDEITPYRMDDVYVGMLANKSCVTPVHHDGFIIPFNYEFEDCEFVPNALLQHRATGQCLLKLLRVYSNGVFYYRNIGSYF